MLDFYRRVWQSFLAAFLLSVGTAAFLIKDYCLGSIIMFGLSLFFLVVFVIGFRCDYRNFRKEKKEEEDKAVKIALAESVRRLRPDFTEEEVEFFVKGR